MLDQKQFPRVLVTGGAGYVGAVLVPQLLAAGYKVRVLDLFLFGRDVLDSVKDSPGIEQIVGDIRDVDLLKESLVGCDAVIHLACISNDPSFEMNPALGRSINYDAFEPLVKISRECGVRRFVYASTSSVYGVSEASEVTEDHPLNPLTDYSKYKEMCEPILRDYGSDDFVPVIIRPATLCGYSTRQRLDLTVNILTNHAVNNRTIKVFGGQQMRPNLHIADMVDLYELLLELPDAKVAGRTYNVGYQNQRVADIAEIVKKCVEETRDGSPIEIVTTPSDDLRSYHISSEKIREELGFFPRRSIQDAVRDLVTAFGAGKLPESMSADRYYNIKVMQHAEMVNES